MIDHVMKARLGMSYDKDGETAAKGQVIELLLAELQSHNFFSRKPPRSAWRLDFGSSYADQILKQYTSSSTEDLVATLTMFTASCIERALVDFVLPKSQITKIIASGGGTRNTTLLRFIRERLAPRSIKTCLSDEFGLPAAYKEAIKFATLAFATNLANNIPAASGASSFAVLGKMSMAPRVAISEPSL
jgi:anhydro-N-acetylmuramic acid kinase